MTCVFGGTLNLIQLFTHTFGSGFCLFLYVFLYFGSFRHTVIFLCCNEFDSQSQCNLLPVRHIPEVCCYALSGMLTSPHLNC